MLRFTSFLFCLSAFAQNPVLSISGPSGNIKAGSTVQFTIALSGTNTGKPAAVQADLTVPGTSITCATAQASIDATKTVSCKAGANSVRFVIAGLNANGLSDGAVATITVNIPPTMQAGTFSSTLSGVLGASPTANLQPLTTGVPFTFGITNVCDLNNSGTTDAADFTLGITQVLNGSGVDINGDGQVNILDLQRISNAATTGTCSTQ